MARYKFRRAGSIISEAIENNLISATNLVPVHARVEFFNEFALRGNIHPACKKEYALDKISYDSTIYIPVSGDDVDFNEKVLMIRYYLENMFGEPAHDSQNVGKSGFKFRFTNVYDDDKMIAQKFTRVTVDASNVYRIIMSNQKATV